MNRLTENRDGSTNALLQGYAYDKTGNRTSATVGAVTTPYTYPAGSHRLSQVGAAAARVYDNNGNTTSVPGTTTKNFVYGDHNRMTQAKNGSTVVMNYVYNGKGEQVRKYLGTTNTYSAYDEAGHWIGDYGNAGGAAPTQQVIWMDDLPVGVFVGSGASQKLHYIEADALGTPRVVVDPTRGAAGTAVWNWDLTGEAFGTTAPNQNPDGDANSFVFNMRFPGQRYDSASGLNYNYFRDYEATTGRYSQSDPIGLEGGMSTYSYVKGDPFNAADPKGLIGYICKKGNNIGIALPIFFKNGSEETIAKMISAIERTWSGNFGFRVKLVVQRAYSSSSAVNTVEILPGSGVSQSYSNYGFWYETPLWPRGMDYPHEVGHFLGLDDLGGDLGAGSIMGRDLNRAKPRYGDIEDLLKSDSTIGEGVNVLCKC